MPYLLSLRLQQKPEGSVRERERERKREREERAREGVRRGCQLGRESGATLRLGSWDQ